MHDKEPHGKPIAELVSGFQTHLERGLTQQEAQDRLAKLGANELTEHPRPGFLALLWDQFNNYLVIILIVAALIALALGEWVDSIAIMFIVVLNAVVGVIQESKAEQALAALKKMSAPNAQVIRDGHQITIPGRELVPGDIVLLEAGNYIPADMRLVTAVNLKVEEASWRQATTFPPTCAWSRPSISRSKKPRLPANRYPWRRTPQWCWTRKYPWATAGTPLS